MGNMLALIFGLTAFPVHALTASQLVDLARDAESTPALLRALPPALLNQPVVIFNSRSTQAASTLFPRVLLFERDLMISYNGLAESTGYAYVEVIAYDRARAEFDFYRLQFAESGLVVHTNPEDCLRCHRGRPIWPSRFVSPAWPGVYGTGAAAVTGSRESELLAEFITHNRANPRYAVLPGFDRLRAYPDDAGHALSAHNEAFEDSLVDTMSHYMMSELRRGPRFNEAAAPLVAALDPPAGDHVVALAPQLGLAADELRPRWSALRNRVEFQWSMQAQSKAQRSLKGLGLPMNPATVAPVDVAAVDRLTSLDLVLDHFGYGDLMGRLFSNNDWLGIDPPGALLERVARELNCERRLDGTPN